MIAVVPAREVAPEFTAAAAGAEDCQVAECACDQCRTLCHCDFCPVLDMLPRLLSYELEVPTVC